MRVSFRLGLNGFMEVSIYAFLFRSTGKGTRVLFRIPLPYKIGEDHFPGNVDEKIRCEAATYIHIRQCCPEIPIPLLLGFGLPAGPSVSVSR